MTDGIEIAVLHERRGSDGGTFLMGFLNGVPITMTADKSKPGSWRLSIHDLARSSYRDSAASSARAISAPDAEGWYTSDMNDDIPMDVLNSKQEEAEHE